MRPAAKAFDLEALGADHFKAETTARRLQQMEIPLSPLAEAKIIAHHQIMHAQLLHQQLLDEGFFF